MSVTTRITEEHRVISVRCIDREDHASGCDFALNDGVLPCSCDATRKRGSWWSTCWLEWNKIRVSPGSDIHYRTHTPDGYPTTDGYHSQLPWPVKGPDGDPWIPGRDFDDTVI